MRFSHLQGGLVRFSDLNKFTKLVCSKIRTKAGLLSASGNNLIGIELGYGLAIPYDSESRVPPPSFHLVHAVVQANWREAMQLIPKIVIT